MNYSKLPAEALTLLKLGEYDRAIALWEESINYQPNLLINYWYLGLTLLLQGNSSEAQAIWLSALMEINPEEIDSYMAELLEILYTTAKEYLDNHQLTIAANIYTQILSLDEQQIEAHLYLGNALAQQANFDEAIECWQAAINLKPDLVEAYHNQAVVWQKLAEFEPAIFAYHKILEITPNCSDAYYNIGWCLCQQGKQDEAIFYFEAAIKINSNYTQAWGELGYIWLQKGNVEETILCWQKAIQNIEDYPNFAEIYCNWRDSLVKEKLSSDRLNSNADLLKKLVDKNISWETYFYLGNVLYREKHYRQAIAAYQKAIDLQPQAAEIYFILGECFNQIGDYTAAINNYQKAIEINPLSDKYYLSLGYNLYLNKDFNKAINCYQQALNINPNSGQAYFNLGLIMLNQGNWEVAITYYQNSLKFQLNTVEIYYNLAIAFARLNNLEAVIDCFRTVIKINPDLAKANFDIINIIQQENNLNTKKLEFLEIMPVDTPQDFYEFTNDWAKSHIDTTNYINIYPENTIDLKPPHTPDRDIHFSFRFTGKIQLPASFVAIIPNGRYWCNKTEAITATITDDNKILADISPEFPILSPGHPDKHPSKHSIFNLGKLPPIHTINSNVAVLSGLFNNGYFHWLFDILPRIELLRHSGIDINEIDYFFLPDRLQFQQETLNILGIPKHKIISPDNYPHIQATQLIVPSFPGSVAWMPKWVCDFLKNTFLNQQNVLKSEKIERLYISRKYTANRRIINEDEIIKILDKFGFKTVVLESMSVIDQAALMANAKVIISPHGGGLSNLVFCSPGTKVIEIFSPKYVYPCYWLVSNLVELEYYYLIGEIPEGFYLHKLLCPEFLLEDIFVNIENLLNIMKFAQII